MLPGQHGRHPPLVVGIGVGVQEADAERVDTAIAEPARDGRRAFLVKRPQLGAGVIEPTADGLDQVGGDDPVGLDPEVGVPVAVGDGLAGDLEDELKALGGDEAEPADLALEQLVGRDRGAVADRGDGRRVRPQLTPAP